MDPILGDAAYWQNLAAEQEAGTRDDYIAYFYARAVQNKQRGEAEGWPVFDEVAYVRVLVPGDRNNVVDRKADEADRERWANTLTTLLNRAYGDGPDRFPVKVGPLAKDYSHQRFPDDPVTLVRGDSLPGFEGALCRAPSHRRGWGIVYNKAVGSQGRINFTLAHEFGHYLLHRRDHPDGIKCSPQDMVRWDSEYRQTEQQANMFAATLLMPLDDFRCQIGPRAKPTLDDIGGCADRYDVSLTAATLRWLEYTKRRSVLVLSRDGFILWSRSSSHALKTGAFFRTANVPPVAIPEISLPMKPDCSSGKATAAHDADVWLPEPCEEVSLISDRYDFAISLLHLDDVPHRDEIAEEPEEDAYDCMTNRTLGSSWLK